MDNFYDLHVPGEEHYLADGMWSHNTGKSRALLTKAHAVAETYPGARCLLLRKTRVSMTESVLVTFERDVLLDGHPARSGPKRAHRTAYDYPNGSTLVVGGLDNPDRIMSTDYDFIAVFEATEVTVDDAEKLTTRLRNHVVPYQQIIFDCNPGAHAHWLNQLANQGELTRLLSRHEDNPLLYDGSDWTPEGSDYIAVLDRLTGPRKERLRFGRWATAEGVVFDQWDASIHVIDPFPIPSDWRRYRSIDFGYTNAFVCQWWAMDGDGRAYLYREWVKQGMIVEDHAKRIKAMSEGERYQASVADHDAEDRATLNRHGIETIPAQKDVSRGIQTVQDRLTRAGDGKPRLYVFRDALVARDAGLDARHLPCGLAEEIDGYVWQQAKDGRPVKEEPLKVNDHSCDTARYACMHWDGGNTVDVHVVSPGAERPEVKAKEGESAQGYFGRMRQQDQDWGFDV